MMVYRIKPLEWQTINRIWHRAEAGGARCDVHQIGGSWWWEVLWRDSFHTDVCDSLEAGKAAAESCYQRLLSGALEVVADE